MPRPARKKKKVEPYELPIEFSGFIIARLKCPECQKEFTTAIHVDNFFGKAEKNGGSFKHHEQDGGCGAYFRIIGSKYPYIIAEVYDKNSYEAKNVVAFHIGFSHEVHCTSPETIGWGKGTRLPQE